MFKSHVRYRLWIFQFIHVYLDVAILLVGSFGSVHAAVCDSMLWPTVGNQIRRRGPMQETRFSAVANSRESDSALWSKQETRFSALATAGNQIQCCGHRKESDSTPWPAAGIRFSTVANSRESGSVSLPTAEK